MSAGLSLHHYYLCRCCRCCRRCLRYVHTRDNFGILNFIVAVCRCPIEIQRSSRWPSYAPGGGGCLSSPAAVVQCLPVTWHHMCCCTALAVLCWCIGRVVMPHVPSACRVRIHTTPAHPPQHDRRRLPRIVDTSSPGMTALPAVCAPEGILASKNVRAV